MALEIVVETGTGSNGANAYLSAAEADAILAEHLSGKDVWNALDEDEKNSSIVFATRVIDSAVTWRGKRASLSQALAWPRIHAFDRDGYEIPSMIVPRKIKAATAYLALHLLRNDPNGLDNIRRIQRVKVDAIDVTFRDDQVGLSETIPLFVRELLTGYGYANSTTTVARIRRS